jgi:cytochrome c-type biogenesis protein CcmH
MGLFLMLAALMLAIALAVVLRPLLSRHAPDDPAATARRRMQVLNEAHAAGVRSDEEFAAKRTELGEQLLVAIDTSPPRSRTTCFAAVAVALLLPALAIGLYRFVGNPGSRSGGTDARANAGVGGTQRDMEQAISGLAAKLKQNPNDAEGWTLLGRAYLKHSVAEGRDALNMHTTWPRQSRHRRRLCRGYVTSESHQLIRKRDRCSKARSGPTKNQRGIWLLGIAEYQAGQFDAAIASWNRLLEQLPKDSSVAQSVKEPDARAEATRNGRPLPEEPAVAASAATPKRRRRRHAIRPTATAQRPAAEVCDASPHLTVKVTLD